MTRTINIRGRCLKNWKLATPLLLFSTLLAFSSHSFSQNLVTNPGFENGTSGWSLDDDASAQYTEPSGRSGDRLTHWSSSASYRAETKQTVTGLSAGTYRLSAYTVGGETSGAWLWAYCDGSSYSSPIPSAGWGDWTEVAVEDIEVSGSSCELGITTEDSEWSSFDDVVFEQVSGSGPSEIVIEEGAGLCGVDGSVDSNHSGFNGSGFANTDNAAGNGVDWTVDVPSSGNYTLEWRYANGGSANRPGEVLINGSSQAMVDFPVTGDWESWTSASAEIVLSAGENTIRLEATDSAGLGNIDSLTVTGDSPQAVTCGDNSDDGACGEGSPHATVTGAPGNYQVNGNGVGGNYLNAIRTAINSLSSGRTSQERVSVMADGSIGNNSISLPSHTALEVCGTMNVGNSSGTGAIRAIGVQNVAVPHLKMTGSPYFGLHFADAHGLHLGQIDLRLSGGLGIRFDRDRPGSTNVRMDHVYVSGAGNHGVETWNIDGLEIGTVIARNTSYAGLLLNNTRNANIGLVDGEGTATGTGYATLRFANTNGRINGAYPTNIYVDRVISRGGGRGFFCVSNSGGAEINHIDFADNGNNSILIENCHNITLNGGQINGGGEVRLAARSEFPNNSDITISNLDVFNTNVRENPCGNNVNWINVNVQGGSYNVCN